MRENVGDEVETKIDEGESRISDTWFSEAPDSAAAYLMKVSGGRHSGANLPLTPGKYSLGQDQDCDFIFLDDAFLGGKILLDVTGGKPILEIEGAVKASIGGKPMESATQILEAFETVEIGLTRFALGPARGPWPEAPKPQPAPPEAAAEGPAAEEAAPGKNEPQVRKARSGRFRLLTILSSAIPLVASGLYFALKPAKPKPNPAADVRAIISEMKLPEVTLEDSTRGLWVKGFVPTEKERAALIARLSAYNPGIRARIISAEETRGSVQSVLDLYNIDLGVEIGARGKAILTGVYDDASRLKDIVESVKQGVQSETDVENKVLATGAVYPYLNQMLSANMLSAKVRVEARNGKVYGMLAKNKMEAKELEAWKTVKTSFRGQFGLGITDMATEKLSPTLLKLAYAARELETQLIGVTVGDLAHISMKRGGKYFEGARLKSGPFIRAIHKDRIVLTVDGIEDTYYIRKDRP